MNARLALALLALGSVKTGPAVASAPGSGPQALPRPVVVLLQEPSKAH